MVNFTAPLVIVILLQNQKLLLTLYLSLNHYFDWAKILKSGSFPLTVTYLILRIFHDTSSVIIFKKLPEN